jgi:hypothetical protein
VELGGPKDKRVGAGSEARKHEALGKWTTVLQNLSHGLCSHLALQSA